MFRLIKINRKKIVLLILFSDVILFCCIYVKRNLYHDTVTATAYMKSSDNQYKREQLLVNTYLIRIQKASDDFYEEYYTISPIVNYYSVWEMSSISDYYDTLR